MSNLSEEQIAEVQRVAELETRKYFDHYLLNVHPIQQKASREHTHLMIEAHNLDSKAHGGVERKVSRFLWMITGAATVGGGAGAGLMKLLVGQ